MRTTFTRAVIGAATTMLQLRQTRRSARLLWVLSDAQLKDIGLTRSDIGRVAYTSARRRAD